MGLISLLGKAAVTIASNLDKVDNIGDIVNVVPEKIDKLKEAGAQVKALYRQHEKNKFNKFKNKIRDLDEQSAKMNAKFEGSEYEETVQINKENLIPLDYAIPPQYNDIMHIGENLFSVNLNDKYGIIDIDGKTIIPFEYDYIYACDYNGSEDFIFAVEKGEKWGYINLKNEMILDFVYNDAWNFKQGLAPVSTFSESEDDYTYGYINKNGDFVIPSTYESARPFNEKSCAVVGKYDYSKEKILYGVINLSGNIVVNCRYDSISMEDEYIIGMSEFYDSDFFDYKGITLTKTEEMISKDTEIKESQTMLFQSKIYRKNKDIKNQIIPYFNSNLIYGYFIQTDDGSYCKIEPMFEEAYYPNKFGYARVKYNGLYGVIKVEKKEV